MEVCSIDGCTRKKKYVKKGWCQTHYHRWWRTGAVNGLKQQRGASGEDCVNWKGDDITYRTAHSRVQKARGKASEYDCAMCGEKAAHWAFDGTDPAPKYEYFDNWGKEIPYSTDVQRYHPLCRGCHLKVDRYGHDLTLVRFAV